MILELEWMEVAGGKGPRPLLDCLQQLQIVAEVSINLIGSQASWEGEIEFCRGQAGDKDLWNSVVEMRQNLLKSNGAGWNEIPGPLLSIRVYGDPAVEHWAIAGRPGVVGTVYAFGTRADGSCWK